VEDYLDLLSEEEKQIFVAMAEYAFSLGYKVKRDKTKDLSYRFSHPKIHKHMLRFSLHRGKPVLRIKFYAAKNYSGFFQEALRRTVEEYDFRYTGCYGCGKCDGTQGYTVTYPDGREYFRCGTELIEIHDLHNLLLSEMMQLFKNQHEYFMTQQITK